VIPVEDRTEMPALTDAEWDVADLIGQICQSGPCGWTNAWLGDRCSKSVAVVRRAIAKLRAELDENGEPIWTVIYGPGTRDIWLTEVFQEAQR